MLAAESQGPLIGAGSTFEDHVATARERAELRDVVGNLQKEVDELEGWVTWFCIRLEDAETNPQLKFLRDEVTRKRREREQVVLNMNI